MPKKINPELRARAFRMVQEHQQDYPSQTAVTQAVAKQLGWVGRPFGAGSCRPTLMPASGRGSPRPSMLRNG